MSGRKILVTSALPYANGSIHLGHMVEFIQTDVWVRFQKMRGHECHYVCADDAHGTAIMLRAQKEGISEQDLIDGINREHQADFKAFLIEHDFYHSTHSKENQEITYAIYESLYNKGYITKKTISQAYDPVKNIFLPDRFIKGTCPKCKAKDQYGDNCEACGTTYDPLDLIEPYSVLSNATPTQKDSEHFFFDLPQFEAFLKHWLQTADIQQSMRNKIGEWFEAGLQQWDISRDAPYWGFKIPHTEDKYFYVWLDAPIGYMGSFKALCAQNPALNFDDYWQKDSQTELYHFIGKDIAYFHMLFWPSTLEGVDLRKPTGVFCHGFLTVNGEKMSKSRGTFIKASTYLKHLRPEYLRYYFASKLNSKVEDLDLNFDDFKQKVNSDLVGKLINLASRCAPFLAKASDNRLADSLGDSGLFTTFAAASDTIADYYEKREFAHALREIMRLCDMANEYIDEQKPWVKAKEAGNEQVLQTIASVGLNAFRQLVIYLAPVLPHIAKECAALFNVEPFSWRDTQTPLLGQRIEAFKPMMQRVEDKAIQAIIDDSKEDLAKEHTQPAKAQGKEEISIEDFAKLDLRVAKVLECEAIPEADKLLKFKLDVGELGERQVFSGIKKYHAPEELVGQLVVYIANLKPRKMRFGMSEGMILSASDDNTLQILLASGRAKAGMKIS